MKILLTLLLLIPSLSWGKSEWKLSSLNLTQVLQMQEVEIVQVEKIQTGTRYHLRDVKQFYICNLFYSASKPRKSECFYEDW
tara:strand:+ start:530 stop:775 length:246 start_codon:yes stop_codon:yes gene_type:complete